MMIGERLRARAALGTRWDMSLEQACAEFAATVRRILDLAERSTLVHPDLAESMYREHRHLQCLLTKIRLLAGGQIQLAARQIVRHTWALQLSTITGADPRASDYPSRDPRERTISSLFDFYHAVRRQLQVPDADDVVPVNPPLTVRSWVRPRGRR
jgi:hypothetical protein